MYITGKKARCYVNQYNYAGYRAIYDVYNRPSGNKITAWKYCMIKCNEMNGRGLTVLSYNKQIFTAAWQYTHPDTGVSMLHVETYSNSYDMEM